MTVFVTMNLYQAYVVVNVLHLVSAMNSSSMTQSTLWQTYEYLNMFNDISLDNIVIVAEDQDSLQHIATHTVFANFLSFSNKVGSYFSCQHDMLAVHNLVKTSKNSLFILFDVEQCGDIKQSITSDNTYDQNSWLFLLSTEYKEKNLTSVVSGLIDPASIHLNSQIYILVGSDTDGKFIEVYRECKENPILFKDLIIFSNKSGIYRYAEFIWKRRQNLHHCSICVAYINTALTYEIDVPSHCTHDVETKTTIGGKTFCSKLPFSSHFSSVAKELNISVDWLHSEDNTYGTFDEETGNWNGIVGLLATNKAEISVSELVISESRSRAISFSSPIRQYKHKLYMARPAPAPTWNTFIMILSYQYWIAIAGTVALTSLVLFFLLQLHHVANNQNDIGACTMMASNVASSFCINCLALGQQDVTIAHSGLQKNLSFSIRTILLVTCVFGMMNYFIYNAGMISVLMDQHYEMPVNTLSDFTNKPQYQLLIMGGSSMESYFINSKDHMHHMILSKTRNEGGIISDLNAAEHQIKVNSKKVLFWLSLFENMYRSFPCEIVTPRESFGNVKLAWPFNNKSSYIKLFSYHSHRMMEAGIENRQHKREVQCTSEAFRSFGYGEVFSVFVISGVGFCIAAIYGLIEFASCHYNTKDDPAQILVDTNNESLVKNEIESGEH